MTRLPLGRTWVTIAATIVSRRSWRCVWPSPVEFDPDLASTSCDGLTALGSTVSRPNSLGNPALSLLDRDRVVVLSNSARSAMRSEEHTSELQSLMRISYAVFCLQKNKRKNKHTTINESTK